MVSERFPKFLLGLHFLITGFVLSHNFLEKISVFLLRKFLLVLSIGVSAVATNGSTSESVPVSSSQDSPMDDPLFLHHAENPSTVLVTQPLTGGENYSAWARAVRKALLTKNKLGFIYGTLTLSSPLVYSPSAVQAWIRCDNMVGTWLTNSVSPKLQSSIIYEDTTLEIWNDLRNRFAQTNGPRVSNLQKEISKLHQGEVTITDFFTQLKALWD